MKTKDERKVLFLDIETLQGLAAVFNRYNEVIPASSMLAQPALLMVAWKWQHEKKVNVLSVRSVSTKVLLEEIHKLIEQADAIVGHNLAKFDMPWLRKEMLINNLPPISEPHVIDTLRVARKLFKFTSNRLGDLGTYLGIGDKHKNVGHLWVELSKLRLAAGGSVEALSQSKEFDELLLKMEKYCKNDVYPLQQRVYERLAPWIPKFPALRAQSGTTPNYCNVCNSSKVRKWGIRLLRTMWVQRHRCIDCGHTMDGKRALTREKLLAEGE